MERCGNRKPPGDCKSGVLSFACRRVHQLLEGLGVIVQRSPVVHTTEESGNPLCGPMSLGGGHIATLCTIVLPPSYN